MSHSALTPEQKVLVEDLLYEYRDIFPTSDRPYGRTNLVQHYIDTGDNKPFKLRAYRTSPALRAEIDSQMDTLLKHGIIRPSESPYSSPSYLICTILFRDAVAISL